MSRRWDTGDLEALPEHIQQQIRPHLDGPDAGNVVRREVRRIEQEKQIAFIRLVDLEVFPESLWRLHRWLMPPVKIGEFVHHTPNGGARTAAEGGIFKAMGVRAGYPDLSCDLVMVNGSDVYAGWRCELKASEKLKPTPNQILWAERLCRAGYVCDVAWDTQQAYEQLLAYLQRGKPLYRGLR